MSAVSKKRNTTRRNLLAVASDYREGVQVAFYDTPGFVGDSKTSDGGWGDSDGRIERSVMVSARYAVESTRNSVTMLVVDAAKNMTPTYRAALQHFFEELLQAAARREVMKERAALDSALKRVAVEVARERAADDAEREALASATKLPGGRSGRRGKQPPPTPEAALAAFEARAAEDARWQAEAERRAQAAVDACSAVSLEKRVAATFCLVLNKVPRNGNSGRRLEMFG